MKLIKVVKSSNKIKKYDAYFLLNDKKTIKKTSFGAAGYSDYTKHNDRERKKRYLARHVINEDWNDVTSAGSLSRWILWNKPTLSGSILDFKRKFKL